MTLFFHEYMDKQKASLLRRQKTEQEDLQELKDNAEWLYGLGYNLAEELDYLGIQTTVSMMFSYRVRISWDLKKDESLKDINKSLDTVEPMLHAAGFELNEKETHQDGPWFYFYYTKDRDKIILVAYAGVAKCKKVKVVEEKVTYKYQCEED